VLATTYLPGLQIVATRGVLAGQMNVVPEALASLLALPMWRCGRRLAPA
jgi:hypothetical protein